MKTLILYRPDSEHDTAVQSFVRDFKAQTGKELELVSLDTREGAGKAEAYEIVSYPAILALADDGRALQVWQGVDGFPRISEVAYFTN